MDCTWRPAMVLCAAALVALQENVAKLEGDHKKAKVLAGNILLHSLFFSTPNSFLLEGMATVYFVKFCIADRFPFCYILQIP